jgi:CspA family cold shock protein
MATGTVQFFNDQKGYGFLQPSDGGPDVFVHITALQQSGLETLREGDAITYEVVADKRSGRLVASNIRLGA